MDFSSSPGVWDLSALCLLVSGGLRELCFVFVYLSNLRLLLLLLLYWMARKRPSRNKIDQLLVWQMLEIDCRCRDGKEKWIDSLVILQFFRSCRRLTFDPSLNLFFLNPMINHIHVMEIRFSQNRCQIFCWKNFFSLKFRFFSFIFKKITKAKNIVMPRILRPHSKSDDWLSYFFEFVCFFFKYKIRYEYHESHRACFLGWTSSLSYSIILLFITFCFPLVSMLVCYYAILKVARTKCKRINFGILCTHIQTNTHSWLYN
jgi:hypothetical protein